MKVFSTVLLLATATLAVPSPADQHSVFNYHARFGIPQAESIRRKEETTASRIVGGQAAEENQYGYSNGIVIAMSNGLTSVCGGSNLSPTRVLTAAHCWWDGENQANEFTVVLGSNLLFSGGTRVQTREVLVHNQWNPITAVNDVALAVIPEVQFTSAIWAISLPSDNVNQDFAGTWAIASGYGMEGDGEAITGNSYKKFAWLNVISNNQCEASFGSFVQSGHICTSGATGVSPCYGDSGGPLAYGWGNNDIIIGIISFFSALGCETGAPVVYTRVTSYVEWIEERL